MGKLQVRFFIFIGIIIALVLLIGISFAGGAFYQKSRGAGEVVEVTSQIIMDKITSQSFMVSKTIFIDQNTSIVVDQGSGWSNFLWGQTIEANALVRADVGVDYSSIDSDHITIDTNKKTINIDVPQAEVLDISLDGDIIVESTSGVLKLLLQNDPNADHNLASKKILDEAEESIVTNEELMSEARSDSIEFIKLILGGLGYTVEIN